jgi:hypothetical protein
LNPTAAGTDWSNTDTDTDDGPTTAGDADVAERASLGVRGSADEAATGADTATGSPPTIVGADAPDITVADPAAGNVTFDSAVTGVIPEGPEDLPVPTTPTGTERARDAGDG